MSGCEHMPLHFGIVNSVHFSYRQPSQDVRRDALTVSKPVTKRRKINHVQDGQRDAIPEDWSDATTFNENLFPAPITLPGHELALHPNYPPQPVQEWLEEPGRNKVTPERNIIVRVLMGRDIS
jgi:hypothetical protein